MQDHTYETIVIVGGSIACIVLYLRHHLRKEFRKERRKRAMLRLLNKTGWEPLDAINYQLWLTYKRQEIYE